MNNIRAVKGVTPKLGNDVFIDPMACVTGDVDLGDDVSVWPFVSIRGDLLPIKIGARTNIQDNSVLHTTHASPYNPNGFALTIGEDVTVGHAAVLHGCVLGDRVLIGMHATVLDGAIVENEVIVGAGSLVPPGKTLESGYLYMGSPVNRVRELTDSEKQFFKYSSEQYIVSKNLHKRSIQDVHG